MSISKLGTKFIVSLLIIAIVVPSTFAILPPKKAEASISSCATVFVSLFATAIGLGTFFGFTSVPAADSGKTLTSATSGANSEGQIVKDCIEHELALAIGKLMLAEMTNEMVHWINSGFKGNPAFVTNPAEFFQQVGDEVAGQFIEGTPLSFLCSPFKIQIQTALALNFAGGFGTQSDYSLAAHNQCTLSQVTNNVNNATKDVSKIGWAGWMSLTQNPANNVLGAYLTTSDQMSSKVAAAQGREKDQAGWGNGFLSFEECTDANGNTFAKYGNGSGKIFSNATIGASIVGKNGSVIAGAGAGAGGQADLGGISGGGGAGAGGSADLLGQLDVQVKDLTPNRKTGAHNIQYIVTDTYTGKSVTLSSNSGIQNSEDARQTALSTLMASDPRYSSAQGGTTSAGGGEASYGSDGSSAYAAASGDTHGSNYSDDSSCTIETPGTLISQQLNNQLGVPAQQLGLADDLDKIFNALAGQLFKQIFEGAGGLLGSTAKRTGQHSRLQAIIDQADASSTDQQKQSQHDYNKVIDGSNNTGGGNNGKGKNNSGIPDAPENNVAVRNSVDTAYPPNGNGPASNLTDGNKSDSGTDYNGALTNLAVHPMFKIDLGSGYPITQIRIYQRQHTVPLSKKIPFVIKLFAEDPGTNPDAPTATPVWISNQLQQDFGNVIMVNVAGGDGKNPYARYIELVGDASSVGTARLEFDEVEVYPNTAPTIALNGSPFMTIAPGTPFVDPGVVATDLEDGTIDPSQIKTDYGTFNPNNPAAATTPYTITYTVTDKGGLTASVTRQILVQKSVVIGQ